MNSRRINKETALRMLSAGLTGLLLFTCAFGPRTRAEVAAKSGLKPVTEPKKTALSPPTTASAYTPDDVAAFGTRFSAEVWPLMMRSCTGCHGSKNASQLLIGKDPAANFQQMLVSGHFDPENPASLLARVISPDATAHMPPKPMPAWSDTDVATLRKFVNDLYAKRKKGAASMDEQFPTELNVSYVGKRPSGTPDNTFLTYTQLRGKVKAIFSDDWTRDDKDLFIENLAQFGGADFVRSFNENTKPTAQFLSGVDALSRDVASRAYLTATGPFAGRPEALPDPQKMIVPDAAYKREISRLYQRLLFRDPSSKEMASSFRFIKDIYSAQSDIASQNYDLRFDLMAKDVQGLSTAQEFRVHVVNDIYGLSQTLVDETESTSTDPKSKEAQKLLDGPFAFKANDATQKVTIYNANTHGNVIVSGLEVRGPLPDGPTHVIPVADPSVQPQGAWQMTYDNGVTCYQDDGQNKGASTLVFPLKIDLDGKYDLTLHWRKGGAAPIKKGRRKIFRGANADNVLVEVQSHDKPRLATPESEALPPKGEAHFHIDETDDTVSFRDLKTAFKFGPGDGVEISNTGTRSHVVADAVRFAPMESPGQGIGQGKGKSDSDSAPFFVYAKDARGQDQWKDYKKDEYTFYKPVGPRIVTDMGDEKLKGKLALLFAPDTRQNKWQPNAFYRAEIGYPGEVRNETDVPITVHAQASSPIVHVAYPYRAHVGGTIKLDATGSYNVQQTPLQYTWQQVGGAYVKLIDAHAPQPNFAAPAMSPHQAAWEGLCRALMKHPDFLFTRPISLTAVQDPKVRHRLQLVKIAQDLVGRTPSAKEIARIDSGSSIASMVDGYMKTTEFADYYFRRIRLYLESHGTDEDDEPARLWSWIAYNDRPFKEILTADYSIDTDWKKEARPDYCGKSGVLTMKGFIKGKPGLPHFNYPAQVCEKFLGYVFEVPLEVVKIRNGIAAASTTSPSSVCYSCHKLLTPLAYQRTRWTDDGVYRAKDKSGQEIDDSDHQLVPSYAYKGNGMAAFATQVQNKERFIRTIMQTHFVFYFGREMRYDKDERGLYKRLWETEKANNYNIKGLIRALLTSNEYLNGSVNAAAPASNPKLPVKAHNKAIAHR